MVRITWATDVGTFAAHEPDAAQVEAASSVLAAAYNEPQNRAMLANTVDFTPADVVAQYNAMRAGGSRLFHLLREGTLIGDADLRHIDAGRAEVAILIASREAQGKGMGTLFARMLHVFAFRTLRLARTYVSIVPENVASLRLFARLGYREDRSDAARAFTDDPREVALSLTHGDFARVHGATLDAVDVASDEGAPLSAPRTSPCASR